MAHICNPDLLSCVCRTWICLDIARFFEKQFQPSSGSAWPDSQKRSVGPPLSVVRINDAIFAQQFAKTAVIAPSHAGCHIWTLCNVLSFTFILVTIGYIDFHNLHRGTHSLVELNCETFSVDSDIVDLMYDTITRAL